MPADDDDLGDRMKAYEAIEASRSLDATLPIYARIDGRSFSRFTKGMNRPFDARMTAAMIGATKHLVRDTHARIGYVQSDEINLVWHFDAPDSEPLFGGKVSKLTSVLASLAAAAFQRELYVHWPASDADDLAARLPHFDARVFSLPSRTEAANAILWRAMDARKNAVSMAARAVCSPKAMHGQNQAALREILAQHGVDFEAYQTSFKRGTYVRRVNVERRLTEAEVLRIPERHRPAADSLVIRTEVQEIDMPPFHEVGNRVEVVFDACPPISV